ncbi:MAG: Na+/H+ antiporter NhaA [Parasphingopyxis sp.]|uniref:Na+/H+ antiporter NhaA n=1 Tax=Parasphingopyxis sp. TaxID=1920299 RepID=UPI003FA0AD87
MIAELRPAIKEFLAQETTGGYFLFAAAILAMIVVNSPLADIYAGLWQTPIEVRAGALEIAKPLFLWVNDGLMAIFFFLIGLEVKREILDGELSSMDKAGLPIVAAIGGMAIPALVFVAINWGIPENLEGWAIPAATDIAFALGVLALLGSRVPVALKVLLLAIAIIDDIGAILIIALFYTSNLSMMALMLGTVAVVALFLLNRFGVMRIAPYILIAIILWVCVLKSGVHATLAGVVAALAIPLSGGKDGHSPLKHLEHQLHPWVAFLVLPVFAFANAGVSLAGISVADLLAPLPLGIALGLLIGKQVGIFGFAFAANALGIVKKPEEISWVQLYGLACLAGIGFTMSLFIGTLAFGDGALMEQVKLGVIVGSLISGLLGYFLLRISGSRQSEPASAQPAPA